MMNKDQSFGVIPVRPFGKIFQVLLIQQKKGEHWGFPKGHPEKDESPQQAAIRELKEETGIERIRLIPHREILEETYTFLKEGIPTLKTVRYFIGEVLEETVYIQAEEILSFRWIHIDEAHHQITYPESQSLCKRAAAILTDLNGHSI